MGGHGPQAGRKSAAAHADKEEKGDQFPPHPPNVDILEKGEIFFFYRPKIDVEHPTSVDDVQRSYMVLKPELSAAEEESKQSHESGKESTKLSTSKDDGQSKKPEAEDRAGRKIANEDDRGHDARGHAGSPERESAVDEKGKLGGEGEEKVNVHRQELFRFIILGRKQLPDVSKKQRQPFWAFVDLVTTSKESIKQALGPEEYETKTRGKRIKPAARPAGEGVYCILKHTEGNQSHTHLIYELELPSSQKLGCPQDELNIEEEASFIIQVKNPNQSSPPNLGSKRKATYPATLQSNMGHYRFVSAEPVDYFNYEGCEFILISASDNIEEELGIHLDVKHDERCSALLSLLGKARPLNVKPLVEGEWE